MCVSFRCACCKTLYTPREGDEEPVCNLCFQSWAQSAAHAIAVREKTRNFGPHLTQFIEAKACHHYHGVKLNA